MAEDGQYYPNM